MAAKSKPIRKPDAKRITLWAVVDAKTGAIESIEVDAWEAIVEKETLQVQWHSLKFRVRKMEARFVDSKRRRGR